jgi:hypothetical protein
VDWFSTDIVKKMLPGQHHQGDSPNGDGKKKGLASIYDHETSAQLTGG